MAKIKFIPIETLLEMQKNNEEFKLVEVLAEEYYNQGHIPGAINIPLDQLESTDKLAKTDTIVVYCASYTCEASTKATKKLLELGYENVVDFKAGKKGWTDAGFELEK